MFGRARLFGLLVTLVFLALSLWRVNLNEVGHALSAGDYRWVIPAAVVTFLGYVVRTGRWRYIVAPSKDVPLRSLFPVLMIGFMANNVLPARMGEFVRAYALSRQEGIPKSRGLATILIERVFDGLTLVTILAILSTSISLPGWGQEIALIGTALFVGALGGVALLLTNEPLVVRIIRTVLAWAPASIADVAEQKTRSFTLGLGSLRRPGSILQIVLLSALVWSLEALSYLLIIRAFDLHLTGSQPLLAALLTLVMVNLGIMLPSAPGYVGTFQFFAMLALGVFGVAAEPALGVAVVSHVMQFVLVTSIGLVCLARSDLSFAGLRGAPRNGVESAT